MLVLSMKPLQKLTGTGRQAGKPMCREAAPPKTRKIMVELIGSYDSVYKGQPC